MLREGKGDGIVQQVEVTRADDTRCNDGRSRCRAEDGQTRKKRASNKRTDLLAEPRESVARDSPLAGENVVDGVGDAVFTVAAGVAVGEVAHSGDGVAHRDSEASGLDHGDIVDLIADGGDA